MNTRRGDRAWGWVPTVYLAEAVPYAVVNLFAVGFFELRGVALETNALLTSLLGLPWALKPLWSPWLERVRRLPRAVCAAQCAMGACFFALAAASFSAHWLAASVAAFAVLAALSATHDCLADGFYIRALSPSRQAFFTGVRNAFYRVGMLAGFGGLMVCYGKLAEGGELAVCARTEVAWALVFAGAAAAFALLGAWNALAMRGAAAEKSAQPESAKGAQPRVSYIGVLRAFFAKADIGKVLFFILAYRFAEAQLSKVSAVFMLAPRVDGGLGLSASQCGQIYGIAGVAALLLGGIAGGWLIARKGLRACFWPMALAMNAPDLIYVWFSCAQPQSLAWVGAGVVVEQFGYGFGFSAFMVYLLHVSRGRYAIAHYAFCTAFMALGMLIPGAVSGRLAAWLGYPMFFAWVCATTLVSFAAVALAMRTESAAPIAQGAPKTESAA